MRKTTLGFALCLALSAPFAHAAGFDCGKAGTPAEEAVCASPKVSALDGQLATAFKGALANHADKADALKLDQRHWLAARDEQIATLASVEDDTAYLEDFYRARIAFLKGLDTTQPPKPMDALLAAAPRLPRGKPVPDAFAQAGVPLTLGTQETLDSKAAFPFQPDATISQALKDVEDIGGYRKLAGSPVSSVWTVGGTAHCWGETAFRIDGRKAMAVDTPEAWGADCGSAHGLMRVGDQIVAYSMGDGSVDEVDLQMARWNGRGFDRDTMLALRFDHVLAVASSGCVPSQSPCQDFATQALAAATRYDRSPQPGTLDAFPTGADKAAYAAQLKTLRSAGGMLAKGADAAALPRFGAGDNDGHMVDYSADAQPFPMVYKGETLVGLVDHGHVGWRTNNDWMVSAWRLKGGKLEAVASAYITVNRDRLLLAAPVPPPAPESH